MHKTAAMVLGLAKEVEMCPPIWPSRSLVWIVSKR